VAIVLHTSLTTDLTVDAHVAFETTVSRLTSKSENIAKSKLLYSYFHKYESQYGEFSQIQKLEERMAELFPQDPKLQRFSSRFSGEGFDPTAVRPIVSPATQMRPKVFMRSAEKPMGVPKESPRAISTQESSTSQHLPVIISPKRLFSGDYLDNPPHKIARGDPSLKGAAGRRLDQQKRMQQNQGNLAGQTNAPLPFVIPRGIIFLLSIIPPADVYTQTKFNAEAIVELLKQTNIPNYSSWKAA